ncbi:MAG: hypothetical protein JWQ38_3127 [Flavipsychrobacter sp.]|nr:hypothetical protein [Flavipsychrobacter sp.]
MLVQGTNSFASHIFGGELLYTYIKDSVYKVTFTVYGDCGATYDIFNTLYTASPVIYITDGTTTLPDLSLTIDESGTEVSPVCTAQADSTNCKGGKLQGVRRFSYSATVKLPYRAAKWAFLFRGNMGTATQAGRSNSISNVIPASLSSVIQLEADLNNLVSDNSSPAYSSIPTPFYCVKVPQQYNHGAIDPDGDSLAFSLVAAADANNGGTSVNYTFPFTAVKPLDTDPNTFFFNELNGQITFTPANTQKALVVCKVSEYRNGILIGTSERELTIVVLSNCQGTPPSSKLTVNEGGAVASGNATGGNIINVCVNTPHVSFGIGISNPDGDKTTFSASALPAGATFSIDDNGSASPHGTFEWSTGSTPIGVYTFYLTIQNDHCPLATRATVAYTINVTPFPEISSKLLSPTQCVHKATMEYHMNYGYTPRTITIMNGTTTYKTYTDSTGTLIDSLPTGDYIVSCSSNPQCSTSIPVSVRDSGDLPLSPVIKNYCINSTPVPISVDPIGPGAIFTWFDTKGGLIFYPPIPDTKVIGSEYYAFIEEYAKCISAKIPLTATVHALPEPQLLAVSMPETICLGDTIPLRATGGVTYVWTPADQVLSDTAGKPYARITVPVSMQLKAIDSFGCADSIVYDYKDIQYCCRFSYPNAFTPNKDGVNDGFRIISYGNLTQYDLFIYNRWGIEVFHTTDPLRYWDGTWNGTPCDLGTYVYYFKAKCLTGNKEESKGDVILIR